MKSTNIVLVFLIFTVLAFCTNLIAQDYGLDFGGSNQYVNCGAVIVTGANPRTIEAWVYARTFNNTGVWQFGDPGSALGEYSLRTHNSVDNRWVVQLWGQDFDVLIPGSINAWIHFALVYDGTNVILYANGILKANQARSLNTISNTFYIGKWGSNYFDGQIDELRVWDIARTQEQIQSSMNVELTGTESGLMAYYPMNEGSGTTITDNSTNSYDGTFVGNPNWVDGVFQPTGSGTDIDPYQISDLNNLYWITQNSDKWENYYIQTADIDATITSSWSDGGWIPIGFDIDNPFKGNYKGQYHSITGLYINRISGLQGMFGLIHSATIENTLVLDVVISGTEYIGGLAGGSSNSIVSNCYSSGSIGCCEWAAGGLVGSCQTGTISKCSSSCNVFGDGWCGGLIGFNTLATIINCYSTGAVSGKSQLGGLIGVNHTATTSNCYSVGSVGSIRGGSGEIGGLIGISYDDTVSNCFWNIETSNQDSSDGGIGVITAQMTNATITNNIFLDAGWDFKGFGTEGTWNIGNGRNDGYPYFDWQYPSDPATLPVELAAFTAQFIENTPTLYWVTHSEIDNMGWFVYRNAENDFLSSEVLSEMIEGHGTTTQPQSYVYEDRIDNFETGNIYFYWLESIDYSGMVKHYDKVAVLTIPDPSVNLPQIIPPVVYDLKNVPNPVHSNTEFKFTLDSASIVSVDIYNILGQRVYKSSSIFTQPDQTYAIYWNGKDEQGQVLENGIYFYNLIINSKIEKIKKLILMK